MMDASVTYSTLDLRIETVGVWVGLSRFRQRERYQRERKRHLSDAGAEQALVEHQMDVMRRWLARAIVRMPVRPLVVDAPVVEYSDTVGDDFIRNRARYRAVVRAIPNPPEQLRDRELRVAPGVHVLRIPYITDEDKARQTAWLLTNAPDDDDEGLD